MNLRFFPRKTRQPLKPRKTHKIRKPCQPRRYPFPPPAGAGRASVIRCLLVTGHLLILLSLGDFAARLHTGSVDALLYIGEYMRSVSMAFMLLWGAGLGLDLWGRSGR